jgi:hypothetical protein
MLAFTQVARADGSFASSDPLVDLTWQSSVRTAANMVSPPIDLDPRGCEIRLPQILLDGTDRDRCPWLGDEAVLDATLLVSRGDIPVMPAMLAWFASVQRSDGSIPSSPRRDRTSAPRDCS